MIELNDKLITSNISEFKVFIYADKNNYNINGILLNEYYGFIFKFDGIREMICSLDRWFDYVNFPMTSHNKRSFYKNSENKKELPLNVYEYKKDDFIDSEPEFILHVQYRINSTWQGILKWVKINKTKRFVSELHLINLIVDAVGLK